MEELILSDFIQLCLDFKNNPTEENNVKIRDFVHKLQVAAYRPMRDKQISLALILNCATFTEEAAKREDLPVDIAEITANTEAGKTIYGILPYAVNLKNDVGNQALSFEVYDILYQFGDYGVNIIDYILKFCKEDYKRLEAMVAEASNYSNLYRLAETTQLLSPENLDYYIEVVKSLKNELTDEKLRNMRALMSDNEPEWQALKETIDIGAAEKAMSKVTENIISAGLESEPKNE